MGENNLSLRHLAASRMEEEMHSVSLTRCLVSAARVSTDSLVLPGASGTAPFVFGAVTFSITTSLESTSEMPSLTKRTVSNVAVSTIYGVVPMLSIVTTSVVEAGNQDLSSYRK